MSKGYDKTHHVKKATGIGDPQCFKGEAGEPKFKVGDKVIVKNLSDLFYTRDPNVYAGRNRHGRRAGL